LVSIVLVCAYGLAVCSYGLFDFLVGYTPPFISAI
jgi:hypothetical protein